jgi:hypothetical protein
MLFLAIPNICFGIFGEITDHLNFIFSCCALIQERRLVERVHRVEQGLIICEFATNLSSGVDTTQQRLFTK